MGKPIKIDFVSDVACPWCAVGLASLEQALARVGADAEVSLRFQPFELNPDMGPEGQDVGDHLTAKYGSTPEQQAAAREGIRQRGADVGFIFRKEGRGRVWNTFDAHRLLAWAEAEAPASQHALKKALLVAYHGEGRSPADHEVLLAAVQAAGLDAQRARQVLQGDEFAGQVRARERFYQVNGIQAVPSVILNDQYLIQGGQPPEAFEQALRQLIAQPG